MCTLHFSAGTQNNTTYEVTFINKTKFLHCPWVLHRFTFCCLIQFKHSLVTRFVYSSQPEPLWEEKQPPLELALLARGTLMALYRARICSWSWSSLKRKESLKCLQAKHTENTQTMLFISPTGPPTIQNKVLKAKTMEKIYRLRLHGDN